MSRQLRMTAPQPETALSREDLDFTAEQALRESEQRLRRYNAVLLDIAKLPLDPQHDWTVTAQRITEAAAHTLEVERVSIWLYDESRTKLRCVDLYEWSQRRHSSGTELPVDKYPAYFRALDQHRMIAAHDAVNDPYTREFSAAYLAPLGITSMLDAAVRSGGTVIGVLCHEQVGSPRYWLTDEQHFVASMADLTSLVLEAAERRRSEDAHNLQQRLSEKRLQALLREKEVLLKEIHHRVKNNLQVIASLLSLQSKHIKDPQALDVFRESQNRIESIALTHRILYQASNLNEVGLDAYLRSLSEALSRSYGMTDDRVTLHVNVEGVRFDIDTAILCGLVISELLSNALKHAFPGDKRGAISIHASIDADRGVVLTVSDTGIGFPSTVDFRTSDTLGLTLINALTDQLNGTLEMESHAGTTVRIRFTLPPPKRDTGQAP